MMPTSTTTATDRKQRGSTTLPNLFVIGAPKCGTTSLHFYLDQHPQVSMSTVKEPWVFAHPDYRDRLDVYGSMLDARAPVRGESSAVYSLHPHFPDVPDRIATIVPGARFIYLVRDPVERALSHYVMLVRDGKEQRSVIEAFADFESPANVYAAASRYATQIQRYLARFDPGRLLVLDQDRIASDPSPVLAEVFRFLGVSSNYRSPAFDRRLNTAAEQRVPTGLGAGLRRIPGVGRVRGMLPGGVRAPLRRLGSRRVRRPRIPPELRASLVTSLAPEVDWLREFTGQPFGDWSL